MGREWTLLRPADPDAILDAMSEEEYARDQFLPYWAELWPATHALLSALNAVVPSTKTTVCDLGCGLGCIGAILAALGHRTIALDIAPSACRYAAANIRRLGGERAAVVCGDWRHSCLRSRFDLILAADVLYEPRWVEPVLSFLIKHLAPHGRACIADPRRASWDTFQNQARQRGFRVEAVTTVPTDTGGTVDIRLLHRGT